MGTLELITGLFLTVSPPQNADILDYSCTWTGPMISQTFISEDVFHALEDYNGDGIADAETAYIFHDNCNRKIRHDKEISTNPKEAFTKDIMAIRKYVKWYHETKRNN